VFGVVVWMLVVARADFCEGFGAIVLLGGADFLDGVEVQKRGMFSLEPIW